MSAIPASSAGVKDMADGSLRITIEFEPRFAKQAFELFGSRGTPLAIAALRVGYAATPAPEKPKGGPLARLAGQWCREPQFQEWIRRQYDKAMGGDGTGKGDINAGDLAPDTPEELAGHAIRVLCEIDSRALLDSNSRGAELFQKLIRGPYMETLK